MASHPLHEFTESQRAAIEAAVAEAEARTSAEIVVAVSGRSGRYDRAEDIFGIALALVAVAAAWLLFQELRPGTNWQPGYRLTLGLGALLALFAFWTFAGAALASRFPLLARPLIPRREMAEEVHRRGAEAFHTLRVGGGADRAAILIYLSLFEHIVWICPDDEVAEKLPDEMWRPIAKEVVEGFRADRPVEALSAAIRHAGDMLAPHFPPGPDNASDAPNTVHSLA